MKALWLGILWLGLIGACSSNVSEPQTSNDFGQPDVIIGPLDISAQECWWCVDAEGFFDLSVTAVVVDEGELNPDGDKTMWWGDLDLNTGKGVFGFTRENADSLNCSAYFTVLSSSPGGDCPSCSFTWELALDEVVIAEDSGGCALALGFEEGAITYGHGKDIVFRDYGHGLFLLVGETWEQVGISIVEDESRWTFFHNLVDDPVE